MYTRRNIRWSVVLRFAWKAVLIFAAWSTLVTVAFILCTEYGINISIPVAPLGTIGVAVAFYVGFKNNQSYDRNWEARKIWGGIVNVSRTWANCVLSYVSTYHADEKVDAETIEEIRRTLIYRHLAWINALRFQLRRRTAFGYAPSGNVRRYTQVTDVDAMREQMSDFLPADELKTTCAYANSATQILRSQSNDLQQVYEQSHLIDDFRHMALMKLIEEMYTLQGKCERIKNTPFPRQYAYFSNVFVWIFIFLLPLGIVGQFAIRDNFSVWLTVPLSVVVSWIFFTMETVGDASEDPFENFANDVPMTALCRTIEIDLRQMLNESDIPDPIKADNDILM